MALSASQTEHLQDHLSWIYPKAYQPETWMSLLPRFIDEQLDGHYQAVENYQQHAVTWQQSDPTFTAPEAPVPPSMLMYACELHAQQSCYSVETIAFCLFAAEKKAFQFKDDWEQASRERDYYKQLVADASQETDAHQ